MSKDYALHAHLEKLSYFGELTAKTHERARWTYVAVVHAT
jgi:hypothetical protein